MPKSCAADEPTGTPPEVRVLAQSPYPGRLDRDTAILRIRHRGERLL